MSSIGEHTDASPSEAELARIRDDERYSLSEVVVASADPGTRLRRCWNMPAMAGLITTANRLIGAQPGKLKQLDWATAFGYRLAPNVGPYSAEWTPWRERRRVTL